jgi:hypothetical protein
MVLLLLLFQLNVDILALLKIVVSITSQIMREAHNFLYFDIFTTSLSADIHQLLFSVLALRDVQIISHASSPNSFLG